MTIRKGSQYVRCLLSSTDSFSFYLLFKILKISSTSGWLSSRIIWSSSFNKISLYDIHVYCLAFYSTYIDETISNKVPFSYTLFIYLRNSLSWLYTPTGYSNFQWKTTKFILIKFENDDSDTNTIMIIWNIWYQIHLFKNKKINAFANAYFQLYSELWPWTFQGMVQLLTVMTFYAELCLLHIINILLMMY